MLVETLVTTSIQCESEQAPKIPTTTTIICQEMLGCNVDGVPIAMAIDNEFKVFDWVHNFD